MAHHSRIVVAFIAALGWGCPVAAQVPEPGLPRVIYGTADPQVIYGPASPAPQPAPERSPGPSPAPPAPDRTSLTYGWEPAGPPVWYRSPARPPPGWPGWGPRPEERGHAGFRLPAAPASPPRIALPPGTPTRFAPPDPGFGRR